MSKTVDQIIEIISSGGNVKIDSKSRPYKQIEELAKAASYGKGGLVLSSAEKRTTQQLVELSRYNKHGNIMFEVS